MNFGGLYKLYAYAIGYLVAVIIGLNMIAALSAYVVPLMILIGLLIIGRLVWWYTRW